jgi:hypothetical protein
MMDMMHDQAKDTSQIDRYPQPLHLAEESCERAGFCEEERMSSIVLINFFSRFLEYAISNARSV